MRHHSRELRPTAQCLALNSSNEDGTIMERAPSTRYRTTSLRYAWFRKIHLQALGSNSWGGTGTRSDAPSTQNPYVAPQHRSSPLFSPSGLRFFFSPPHIHPSREFKVFAGVPELRGDGHDHNETEFRFVTTSTCTLQNIHEKRFSRLKRGWDGRVRGQMACGSAFSSLRVIHGCRWRGMISISGVSLPFGYIVNSMESGDEALTYHWEHREICVAT